MMVLMDEVLLPAPFVLAVVMVVVVHNRLVPFCLYW